MPRRPQPFEFGPWKGARYTTQLPGEKSHALWARDMMVLDDGTYYRRPSWQAIVSAPWSATSLQALLAFNLVAGGLVVIVVGGQIYATDGSGAPTLRVTTANLTTAGITLDATATVYGCQFGNKLVFNDGINRPFVWDGTTGAGGLTSLTNAPSKCFGKPTVYYAKLFFIKDVAAAGADRNTFVWSEENQPNTGYEAGGFNNSWPLVQMGQGGLYAILGLNDGLYYFRRTSIGVVRGAVTPDFRAAGVHDDVSLEHGTTSPKGVCYYREHIWFIDETAHPYRLAIGGPLEALWPETEGLFGDYSANGFLMSTADVAAAFVCPVPALDKISFWFRDGMIGTSGANRTVLFGLDGDFESEWSMAGGSGNNNIGAYPTDAIVTPYGPRPGITVYAKDATSASTTWKQCDLPTQFSSSARFNLPGFPDDPNFFAPKLYVVAGDPRGGPQWRFERVDAQFVIGENVAAGGTLKASLVTSSQMESFLPGGGSLVGAVAVNLAFAAGRISTGRRASWIMQRYGAYCVLAVGEDFNFGAVQNGWGLRGVRVRAFADAPSASMASA